MKTLKESCKDELNDSNCSVEFSDATAVQSSSAADIDCRSIYVGNVIDVIFIAHVYSRIGRLYIYSQ